MGKSMKKVYLCYKNEYTLLILILIIENINFRLRE